MDSIKNIQTKLYTILSEAGIPDAEDIVKKTVKEAGREAFLQKAKEIEKTLQEKYANKYLWQIVKEDCEKRGVRFDERREEDKEIAKINLERDEDNENRRQYIKKINSHINGILAYNELMAAYTEGIDLKYHQCEYRNAGDEFDRLIDAYVKSRSQETIRIIGNVMGYSSRNAFIVRLVSAVYNAYPSQISALRDLAQNFQIGRLHEDKIIFCHMQRFWAGYGWILKLMVELDMIERVDVEELEAMKETY